MNNKPYALDDYKVGKRIASGGFGFVYSGKAPDGKRVAIKYERTCKRITRPYLQHEADVYRLLEGNPCVPKVYAYGREERWNILVFDLLGTSLETLFEKCEGKFSLKTMLMLAPQIIDCIEYMHSKGIIHRDIKPDNFLMGTGDRANFVHIIDFGLARRFRHPRTLQHFPYFGGHNFFGTTRFASLKALEGCSQSRRDDLESTAYSLIYFLRGRLPWQGLRAGTEKHRDQRVKEKKRTWTPERLCEGLPGAEELIKMLHYVKSLDYTDEPDYAYLKNLFRDRFQKEGYELDYDYDWLHVVEEECDSLSVMSSKRGSNVEGSIGDKMAVHSGSADDEADGPARKIFRTSVSRPASGPARQSLKTHSRVSPISAANNLYKDWDISRSQSELHSTVSSRKKLDPPGSNAPRHDARRSSASKLSGAPRPMSKGSSWSSDSSTADESTIKRGDLVLIKFLARPTLERDGLKTDTSEPLDNSYWHNPSLSEDRWRFPFRPALVTKVVVRDKYTALYVLPIMQRAEGLEKIPPTRRPAFFTICSDKEAGTGSESDKEGALKLQLNPAWPIEGTYVHHQYENFRIHTPTDAIRDIKVVWRLDKQQLKCLFSARDGIMKTINDDDYLTDAGSETDEVRRRFRMRRVVMPYPLYGEVASLTEDALARSDVEFKGSNGWLPEFYKVDRRRKHENGYYTGDSDEDEDDENLSMYTGRAPGNRRLSCTLAIEGDVILEAASQAGSDLDSTGSTKYRSPRSSKAGSYRSRGSLRHSKASSAASSIAGRSARSLRHAVLDPAACSSCNSPAYSSQESESDSDHAPLYMESSVVPPHAGSEPASPSTPSTLSSHSSFKHGSADPSPSISNAGSAALTSASPGTNSTAGSTAGSVVSLARSLVESLAGSAGDINELATAIERKVMVDEAVQTGSTDEINKGDTVASTEKFTVDKAIQTEE